MEKQLQSSWWDRNWKWFMPLGCLSGLLLLAGIAVGILYFVFGVMKSSDAYQQAFAKAQASPAVVRSLGAPIRDGLFVSGNIHVNGPTGAADLSIPISGPKGKGTVTLRARKAMGAWTFDELMVQFEDTGQRIDLLDEKTE